MMKKGDKYGAFIANEDVKKYKKQKQEA